jgi:hypothetical protein
MTTTTTTAHPESVDTKPGPRQQPSHAVFHVRDFGSNGSRKAAWTRIGAAWPHSDGQGFNVQITCVPLDGRLSLRVITDIDTP